jgi:hypothetical protein
LTPAPAKLASIELRARSRRSSSDQPNAWLHSAYSPSRLAPQQHRVVGIDRHDNAGTSQAVDRVRFDRWLDAQREVGGGAHAQGDPSLDQQGDELGVFDRPHAMVDAVGTEQFDGVAHALRAAGFAGMHGAAQARATLEKVSAAMGLELKQLRW